MNSTGKDRWRRFGAVLGLFLFFGAACAPPAAAQQAVPDIHAGQAQMICSGSNVNTDPWLSGIAVAQPGRWWNPKRYGTGWDFVYNDDRTKLKAFLYTFNASGHSTWLATNMTHISPGGEDWRATIREYRKNGSTITSSSVGEVVLHFFRDDPSRVAARWKWNAIPAALLPAGYAEECLSDMTRLNPTYYAGNGAPVTQEFLEKDLASTPAVNQIFSGYWNNSTVEPVVDQVPGVVMTLMQVSLGPDRGKWGEAVVRLTFNNAPVGNADRGAPVFVQAQRVALATNVPLDTDTFNLYYHYADKNGYPNGYAVTDCATSTGCNTNQLVGTYTRYFRPETNYRSAHTTFFVDPTKLASNGTVPGAPVIGGAANPTYLASGNDVAPVTRTNRLQEISVNQYVCQAPVGGTCSVWVSWAGNGIGKAWKRDLGTVSYGTAPIDTADFGVSEQVLAHGERAQFELWQGTPGTPGALLLDKAPEVRAVGPTPGNTGPVEVPPAPVISNLGDLPAHDASVGALVGEADVSGGAATYTVPVDVPPGRNGMQPSVSLAYSSRGGNGVAGLGWNVNAGSSIGRCARTVDQDGYARGVRMDGSDALCLDGQRLVGAGGAYGSTNAEYRTEVESFARIRQNGSGANLGAGGVCFTVEQKDGRKATYGCIPANYSCPIGYTSPRVRPMGVSREHSWLLSRVEDAAGNTMDYCYRVGDLAGGEVLLQQIRYTGSVLAAPAAVATPSRYVEFEYDVRPNTGRANDFSSSAVAGGQLQQTRRLTAITTYSPDSAYPVRRYRLDYFDPIFSGLTVSHYSGRSLLRRITECGYDTRGGAETCRAPTEFTWSDGTWEFASRKLTVATSTTREVVVPAPMPQPVWQDGDQSATAPVYRRQEVIPVGDLDGDGSREILVSKSWFDGAWQGETQLSKVTADRVVQGIVTLTGFAAGAKAVDIDGDGIAELINGNRIYKYTRGRGMPLCDGGAATCTAPADTYFQMVTSNLPGGGGVFIESLADFNGDGAPDVLVRMQPLSICHLGNGGGTDEKSGDTKGGVPGGQAPLCLFLNTKPGPIVAGTTGFAFSSAGQIGSLFAGVSMESVQHVADLDGNGAADVVISDQNGIQRVLSGQASGGSVTFTSQLPAALGLRGYTRNLRWMDVNGDGLDDVVIADIPGGGGNCSNGYCYATWVLQLNRGGSFGPEIYPASPAGIPNPGLALSGGTTPQILRYYSKMIPTDVDSDGRADLLYPAHFAARMCFTAFLSYNQFLTPRPPKDCPTGFSCEADVCPAPPPEDAPMGYAAHPGAAPDWADTFRSGLGEFDPSVYRYNAIRFVQTGPDAFRMQVDETPIVAGASQLGNQRGRADDYFGDGLADIVADAGCPLKPTQNFPNNTCRLSAGGTAGPGSATSWLDTAQTIQLGQLVDPVNVNLVINENLGDGARNNLAPMFPDLIGKAVNGLGDLAKWDYYPLSSSAGRSGTDFPLYKIDAGYVDARHFLFQSSMPVVSVMERSNGSSTGGLQTYGGRTRRYAYEGAMYNASGRGFQGFRKISSEAVATLSRVVRSITTFHQKFPLTGRIERVETTLPNAQANNRLSLETFVWRCNRSDVSSECPGQAGSAPAGNTVYWPFVHLSGKRLYDLASAEAGASVMVGRVDTFNNEPNTNTSGWTAEGNLRYQRVVTQDGGNGQPDGDKYYLASHESITVSNYDTSLATSSWWLDKLTDSTTSTNVSYFPRSGGTPPMDLSQKTLVTNYAWNPNRTLASKTVTDPNAAQSLITANGYPTPNLGLPTSVTVSGAGVAPVRETRMDYSADGYFETSVTAVLSTTQPALNHVTTTISRASDGQPSSVTDPNGLKVLTAYDAFGLAVERQFLQSGGIVSLTPPARTALSAVCVPCGGAGAGEEMATYFSTTVQDGAPTLRIWFDSLRREVKRATRGFDGRWVNVVTKYDALGSALSTSAPHFDGETPLLTQFTYDRLNRMRSKRTPTAELNATQGDMLATYTYSGLRTDVVIAPVAGAACTSAPNLCFTVRHHRNMLGQVMRTEDALAGTYPGVALGGVTDYWLNPSGALAAIRDGKGNTTTAVYNALGHRLASNDPNQGAWTFTYNALGEMLTQTDARGVQTLVSQRDGLGRALQQRREPPAGAPATLANEKVLDSWQYDPVGAKGQVALQQRQRSLAGGSPDGSVPVWKESYSYDAMSARMLQRTTEMEQAAPGPLVLSYVYQYDPYYGHLSAVTYPNSPQPLTVWKRYTRYGAPSGIVDARLMTPMWSMTEADAYGKPTREQFGYTFYAQASYSRATGQMRSQSWRPYEVPTFTDNLDEFAYAYDALGNLSRQERKWRRYDESAGYNSVLSIGADQQGRTLETYTYDKVQRLTAANRTRRAWNNQSWTDVPANPATVNYGYDAVGNILVKSDFADSYTYGGNPGDSCGPNAVKTIVTANDGAPQTRTYQCDPNGNQVGETGAGPVPQSRTLVYDGANLPTRIQHTDGWTANALVEYAYGPDNARYKRTGEGGTLYFGADGYELEITGGGNTKLHRVELGPVSYTRQVTGSTAQPSLTNYQIRDRLGSTVGVADRWGNFNGTGYPVSADGLLRRSYDPFGMPREAGLTGVYRPMNYILPTLQLGQATRRGFTDHEHVDSVKLVHMNGRMYDYRTGRFLSVDPFIQQPTNSQSLNPYSYVLNNPLGATDPTGYLGCGEIDTTKQGTGTCDLDMGDGTTSEVSYAVGNTQVAFSSVGNASAASAAVSTGVMLSNGAENSSGSGAGGNRGANMQAADIGAFRNVGSVCARNLCHGSFTPGQMPELPRGSKVAEFGISLTGLGGSAISVYELVMGESPLSGDKASRVWAAVGLIPFAKLLKYGDEVIDGVRLVANAQKASHSSAPLVLLDSNVTAMLKKDPTLSGRMLPGEQPVISYVTIPEMRNAVKHSSLKGVPRVTEEIPQLIRRPSIDLRINIRGMIKDKRGNFGDGIIGAQAIENGIPLITNDKALKRAVEALGGTTR